MIPHTVYLANSSGVKVGVTRKNQQYTRWMDQGAEQALPILTMAKRLDAGLVEIELKKHTADKTNWRKMLTNDVIDQNLTEWRDKLKEHVPQEAVDFYLSNREEINLNFPVNKYPEKVKSLNLSKTPEYRGTLMGIKGQYLIFEDNTVFNVRSNEGHYIALTIN